MRAVSVRMWLRVCVQNFTQVLFCVSAVVLLLAISRSVILFDRWFAISCVCACGFLWLTWKTVREGRVLRDPIQAARQIDLQAALNNRITTAVELSKADSHPINQLLLEDAAVCLQRIHPSTIVRLPSAAFPLTAAGALLAAISLLYFAPSLSASAVAKGTLQASQRPSHLNRLTDILETVLADLRSAAARNPSERYDALIQQTENALLEVQDGNLSTAQAFLRLSELQQQMTDRNPDSSQAKAAWQKVAKAFESTVATSDVAALFKSQQFDSAASQIAELTGTSLSPAKLSEAEVTSFSEKLADAAGETNDKNLAEILNGLSSAISEGKIDSADQHIQDLAAASSKHQVELDQTEHLDGLAQQLEVGKLQLAVTSNRSGDGQMGGAGLNQETGRSEGNTGADSQKAGAKTAGNVNGPKSDLAENQAATKQLAELQGQFGEEGQVELKTKSTDERPEFEINRKIQSVLTEYSRQLEADLKQQQVPAGHQGIVRKYFESIRPPVSEHR